VKPSGGISQLLATGTLRRLTPKGTAVELRHDEDGTLHCPEDEMNTAKDEVRQLLDRVPDDASLEDIQYHIYVCQKADRGLEAADQGRVLSQDEVERRMARWLEQ